MDNEPVSRLDEILGPVDQSGVSEQPTSRLSEIIGDAPETISAAPKRKEGFLGAEGYPGEGAISGAAAGAAYGLANKKFFPVASAAELIKAQKNLQAAEGSLKYFRICKALLLT